jgi:hypothetical protein
MRYILSLVLCLLLAATDVRAENLFEVQRMEARHFGKLCHALSFADNYLTRIDFNNDKLMDVITDPSGVTCDGVKDPECSLLGCPHRFYAQLDDGSFAMIAEIQLYSYTTHKRYGNQVLVIETQGSFCKRTIAERCKVTYRVRGTRFVELMKE